MIDDLVNDLSKRVDKVVEAREKQLESTVEDLNKVPAGFLKLSSQIRSSIKGQLLEELTGESNPTLAEELLGGSGIFGNTVEVVDQAVEIFMDMTGSGSAKFNPEDLSVGTSTAKIDHGAAQKESTGDTSISVTPTNVPGSGGDILSAFVNQGYTPTSQSIKDFGGSGSDIRKKTSSGSINEMTLNQARKTMSRDPERPWNTLADQMKSAFSFSPDSILGMFDATVDKMSENNQSRGKFIDDVDKVISRVNKILPYLELVGVKTESVKEKMADFQDKVGLVREALFFVESAAKKTSGSGTNVNLDKSREARTNIRAALKLFSGLSGDLGWASEIEGIMNDISVIKDAEDFEASDRVSRQNMSNYMSQVESMGKSLRGSQGNKYKRARASIETMMAEIALLPPDAVTVKRTPEYIATLRAVDTILQRSERESETPHSERISAGARASMDSVVTDFNKVQNKSFQPIQSSINDVWEELRRVSESENPLTILQADERRKRLMSAIKTTQSSRDDMKKDMDYQKSAEVEWQRKMGPHTTEESKEILGAVHGFGFSGALELLGLGSVSSLMGIGAMDATLEGSVMQAIGSLVGGAGGGSSLTSLVSTAMGSSALSDEMAAAEPIQKNPEKFLTPAQESILNRLQAVVLSDIRRVTLAFSRRIISLPDRDRRTNDLIQATQINPLKAAKTELLRAFSSGS